MQVVYLVQCILFYQNKLYLLCPVGRKVTSVVSGTAVAVWSRSHNFSTLTVQTCLPSRCLRPAVATALRCWTIARPIPACPAWTTVYPARPLLPTARWTHNPTTTGSTAKWRSMAIRAACPTWSLKIPAVTVSSRITTAPRRTT